MSVAETISKYPDNVPADRVIDFDMFNPFTVDGGPYATTGSGPKANKYASVVYHKAPTAASLPYYPVLVLCADALTPTWWQPFNSTLGFKLPATDAGGVTKAGCFPS